MKNPTLITLVCMSLGFAAQASDSVAPRCASSEKRILSCVGVNDADDSELASKFATAASICADKATGSLVMRLSAPDQPEFPAIPAVRQVRAGATTYSASMDDLELALVRRMVSPTQPVNASLEISFTKAAGEPTASRSLLCK